MKMTKIESARIIAESTDNPVCRSILCSKCFNSREGNACKDGNLVRIEKAKAYIKRHESKSKKKDHILDTTKKVEEPKPIKTVGIDNSDVTLALTAQHEPCEHLTKGMCADAFEPCDKDCPANSEIPQPIKFDDPVPEYVYWLEENCITRKRVVEFVQKRYKSGRSDTFALVEGGENPYLKNLYRTLEEAVIVAKKLWNKEVTK